jgi:Fe-S-cluster containining protein
MSADAPPRARTRTASEAPATPAHGDGPPEAVRLCLRDERFLAGIRGLYEEVDRRTAGSGAHCLGGGACCKFDRTGHRLYLTMGELAILTQVPPPPDGAAALHAGRRRCPYQVQGRCRAYARRPLGCRVYFCRPADPQTPGRTYEEFHARLALLHRRFARPYLYTELTAALKEVLPVKPTQGPGPAP